VRDAVRRRSARLDLLATCVVVAVLLATVGALVVSFVVGGP
jgi:hypothetical protein